MGALRRDDPRRPRLPQLLLGTAIETVDDLAELGEPAVRLWCRGSDRVYLRGRTILM